jgi:hypothetical protein
MRFHLVLNQKKSQYIFITKASAKQVFYALSGRNLPPIRKKLGCIDKKVRK